MKFCVLSRNTKRKRDTEQETNSRGNTKPLDIFYPGRGKFEEYSLFFEWVRQKKLAPHHYCYIDYS
jgi:hypothetical protein